MKNLRKIPQSAVPRMADLTAKLVRYAIFLALGFLSGSAVIMQDMSPFGAAVMAAVPVGYLPVTFVGAALGHALTAGTSTLKYISILIASAGIRWALGDLKRINTHKAFFSINAFVSIVATSFVIEISISQIGIFDILLYISEGVLAAAGAFFFSRAFLLFEKRRHDSYTTQEIASAIISIGILLLSLARVEIYDISLGRIVMVVLILTSAKIGRESAGAIAGVAAGSILSLASGEYSFVVGAFSLGGLIAGMFSRFNKIVVSSTFIAACCVMGISAGFTPFIAVAAESALGSLLFLFVPIQKIEKMVKEHNADEIIPRGETIRRAILNRLDSAAKSLSEMSEVVGEVSDKLSKMSASDISGVYNITVEEICAGCGFRLACWQTCREETKTAFKTFENPLTNKGRVEMTDFPQYLIKKCAHPNEVISAINRNYSDFTARESAKVKIAGMRAVVNDQFGGMSELLTDLADEISNFDKDDASTSRLIRLALKSAGYTPIDVICKVDVKRRLSVDIRALCYGEEVNREMLMQMISSASGRVFDEPLIEQRGNEFKLRTIEHAPYEIDFGASQHICGNGRLCGDAYDYYQDGKGHAVMIISDGMGSGGRAAIDSAMASSLMTKLLKGGFSFSCALKIVNSALLVKAEDETLATLDISCLDLYSGRAEFLKAGAPLTLIRRGERIVKVDTASLPAGILREVEFERTEMLLDNGDIIMMFSDGVIIGSMNWLETELLSFDPEREAPESFSKRIVEQVCARRKDDHDDDVTVLTSVIRKRERADSELEKTA